MILNPIGKIVITTDKTAILARKGHLMQVSFTVLEFDAVHAFYYPEAMLLKIPVHCLESPCSFWQLGNGRSSHLLWVDALLILNGIAVTNQAMNDL